MKHIDTLCDIIERLKQNANHKETSVGEILAGFERRGFGPFLLVPSLFLVLPTGAIPGAPSVCGVLLIFITGQILIGFKHPWIPPRFKRVTFDGEVLEKSLDKIKPIAKTIDRHVKPRMTRLVTPVSQRLVALVCMLLAVLIIPLGAIPFAIFLPALAIVFFALGFSVNDGLLIAVGLFVTFISVMGSMFWWF